VALTCSDGVEKRNERTEKSFVIFQPPVNRSIGRCAAVSFNVAYVCVPAVWSRIIRVDQKEENQFFNNTEISACLGASGQQVKEVLRPSEKSSRTWDDSPLDELTNSLNPDTNHQITHKY